MKNNLYTIILFSILGSACAESLDEPGIDWYSDGLDTDGDYIPNPYDDCPLEQEDMVNPHLRFHTEELATDGCPTIDNDGDRVDDKIDACPNDPECWTDSCLVGMSQGACESHICYRGECIRNDIAYSCGRQGGSAHQDALWEVANGYDNERGRELVTACERRLEENWQENQRAEN